MDPAPWNLLRDGTIVRVERSIEDEVRVWISCAYLRARFAEPGTLFCVRLTACTRVVYTPYDEMPIEDLAAIAASEPDLVEAKRDGDDLVLVGSAGQLAVRYAREALELCDDSDDTGRPLSLEELAQRRREIAPVAS